jgi:hypothetical protein
MSVSGEGHPGDLLSAHLDGELPPEVEARVDAHLEACADCRAEFDDLDAARSTLRSLPTVPAPAGLVTGIVRARQRASRRGVALALVAASLAVVVGLAATPAPGHGDDPDRPELALTSEGRRFDAGLDTTVDRTAPSGGTVSGLQRPRSGDDEPRDEDESLLDRLGDRVGAAVSGLLHAVGG